MRLLLPHRLAPHRLAQTAALLALFLAGSARAQDFVPPDLTRFTGTWLWIESQGLVVTSTPQVKGASRTLFLHPDLTYEFHQRTGTRDSTLCRGIFSVGESSEVGANETVTTFDLDGWYEPYEKRMVVDFDGPDTLIMTGVACASCPQHVFVRGQSALFHAEVRRGQAYRRELWGGLVFELRPKDLGWEMAVADSARPKENRLEITTSAVPGPDPRVLDGAQLRDAFARKGKGKTGGGDSEARLKTRRFQFYRQPARRDTLEDEEDRDPAPGRGVLTVERVKLAPAKGGKPGAIESMGFTALIEEERRGESGAKESRP
jgi:hypothetical protein